MVISNGIVFIQMFISILFFISAISKITSPKSFIITIQHFKFSQIKSTIFAYMIILTELLICITIPFEKSRFSGEILLILILIAFAWSVWKAYQLKIAVKCNCFGDLSSENIGKKTMFRIFLLGILGILLMFYKETTSILMINQRDLISMMFLSIGIIILYLLSIAFYSVRVKS